MHSTNAAHECRTHKCRARMQRTNAKHECNSGTVCLSCVSYDVVNFGWYSYFKWKNIYFSGCISNTNTKNKPFLTFFSIFMFSVSMFSANSLVFEYVPTLSTVEIEARIIKHQILMFSVSMFSSMEKYQEYSYFSMH